MSWLAAELSSLSLPWLTPCDNDLDNDLDPDMPRSALECDKLKDTQHNPHPDRHTATHTHTHTHTHTTLNHTQRWTVSTENWRQDTQSDLSTWLWRSLAIERAHISEQKNEKWSIHAQVMTKNQSRGIVFIGGESTVLTSRAVVFRSLNRFLALIHATYLNARTHARTHTHTPV